MGEEKNVGKLYKFDAVIMVAAYIVSNVLMLVRTWCPSFPKKTLGMIMWFVMLFLAGFYLWLYIRIQKEKKMESMSISLLVFSNCSAVYMPLATFMYETAYGFQSMIFCRIAVVVNVAATVLTIIIIKCKNCRGDR